MMLVHEGLSREVSKCLEEYRAAQSSDPNSDDELLQKHIKRKRRRKQLISQGLNPDDYETSSTETSLSTESEEPFTSSEADTDEAIEIWKKVLEEKFAASSGKKEARKIDAKHKKKLGLSPAPSDIPNELLNNSPKKKVASPEKSTGELFKNIVEKSKLNKSTPTKDNGKCKDKAARPVAAANSNGNTTPKKESAKSETHEHHTCMSDHEDGEHGHDHFSEHHPCHCVHCELLGNTPNQRGNFRDEQARARLRKKLEKRKQASGQCVEPKCEKICSNPNNASSRQQGDESSSPTLSSRSTVSSQKDSRTGTPQAKTAKRMPFSFSTAMDLRPVRSSTSSKNIETCDGDYDGKREWIDCAYEDILNMCQEKKLKNTPTNASLNSVQSWLRTAIKDRLDAQKDAKDKMPVHQIIAEEVIAAEEAEKKAEEAKRLKKKKKKQAAKQRKEELKKQEEAKLEAERRAKQKIEEEEAERRAQEKREEEEMENVFTPVDNIEGLDPDDRDVESFKKFCLEFVPKFPRLKIPLQSLNLPPLVVPQ
ncbi:Oidioi.mRNA.OKI2018_I69.chr1.g2905.t1.cds [Oikopleura dioica]|uniref:Oidioi.mRNA.OKI2018_I69.chr1.g2905.t1.cds n=1 Tax=Oikopleura dioica TaxID=34765 RepID=A0ABN7SSH9_OIKDI|nr:Oidioi.mRNA.OKI2018_I69.chr1.g2905.t1.cds [Oikopleura dioica]